MMDSMLDAGPMELVRLDPSVTDAQWLEVEAETVARFGGSIAAICAVTFFASLFFALVISDTYENRNTTGETTETQ